VAEPAGAPTPAAPPPPAANAARPSPASAGPSSPPSLRLPRTATPLRYHATLTVTPTDTTLRGAIDIDLQLAEPTSVIWLNGTDLTIDGASLFVAGKPIAARAVPGGEDFIGFALDAPAPAGAGSKLRRPGPGPTIPTQTWSAARGACRRHATALTCTVLCASRRATTRVASALCALARVRRSRSTESKRCLTAAVRTW
jgi:hypothetical protein